MAEHASNGPTRRLRFRHSTSTEQAQDSVPFSDTPLIAQLQRWLLIPSLGELSECVFEELQQDYGLTRLLIVSRSPDLARQWAAVPLSDSLTCEMDRMLRDTPMQFDPRRIGHQDIRAGTERSAEHEDGFHLPGYAHTADIATPSKVEFHLYWSQSPERTMLHEGEHWPLLATVLGNLAITERLRAESYIDSVTGIYNRAYFNVRLREEIARSKRFGRPLTLALFDLDDFKSLNDSYGHQTGDTILRQMADYVRWTIRSIDVFCRVGGDEFGVLMPDADIADSTHFAERFLGMLQTHRFSFDDPHTEFGLSVSMGAAVYPIHSDAQERLQWCADMALLAAKKRGKGQFLIYEDAFGREVVPASQPQFPDPTPSE